MRDNAVKWNQRYRKTVNDPPTAADVLLQNKHLLPSTGNALDIACGLGGNSLLLAAQGLQVEAWDNAQQALNQLTHFAVQAELKERITTHCRDVLLQPPQPTQFDVIVVSHFLERSLMAALAAALTSGGLIFYQTFCADKPPGIGPQNSDYLLTENELLQCFNGLIIRVYREEGQIGEMKRGWRHRAMLVAEKQ